MVVVQNVNSAFTLSHSWPVSHLCPNKKVVIDDIICETFNGGLPSLLYFDITWQILPHRLGNWWLNCPWFRTSLPAESICFHGKMSWLLHLTFTICSSAMMSKLTLYYLAKMTFTLSYTSGAHSCTVLATAVCSTSGYNIIMWRQFVETLHDDISQERQPGCFSQILLQEGDEDWCEVTSISFYFVTV